MNKQKLSILLVLISVLGLFILTMLQEHESIPRYTGTFEEGKAVSVSGTITTIKTYPTLTIITLDSTDLELVLFQTNITVSQGTDVDSEGILQLYDGKKQMKVTRLLKS